MVYTDNVYRDTVKQDRQIALFNGNGSTLLSVPPTNVLSTLGILTLTLVLSLLLVLSLIIVG
jgi:hypothetical protein